MRKILLTALLATIAAPAFAVTNWNIDPTTSKLTWTVPFNYQPVTGEFKKWTGKIAFDPNNLPASSLDISIDLASVSSNDANRDTTLKGPDFFNTAANTTATYKSTSIRKTSQGYIASGDLSLAGVTKPLGVPFTLTITGDKAVAQSKFKLSRGAFGVGKGQWKSASEISDMVEINFTVAATAAAISPTAPNASTNVTK